MPVALSLFLVLFFLLMNAFFVVAEFSLVRVRKSQVEMAVDEGKAGSKYAKLVADNVNAYLSACQLGITLASLALGWLGEPAVSAAHPSGCLRPWACPRRPSHAIAVAIGFVIITALHIVVGELIPKSLAIFSTERYALFTAHAARVVLPHHVPHHVAVQHHHERRHEAAGPRHRQRARGVHGRGDQAAHRREHRRAASSTPSRTSTWTTSSTWATRTPRPS